MTKPLNEMTVEELLVELARFFGLAKQVPTTHGQMCGQETMRIVCSGNDLSIAKEAWYELARRLAELQQDRDECARRAMACEQSEWHERAERAEAEIERMKPVVDAAQRANQSLFVDWDDLDNLKDKVRQYEEGK